MKTIKSLDNQSLIDMAMQELGNVERLFELALLNGVSITDDIEPTVILVIPDYELDKRQIVKLYSDVSLAPASAYDDQIPGTLPPGGIGFMQIGTNFIVS